MNALLTAWRASRLLPVGAVRVLASAGASFAWRRPGKAVRRLEDNLHRITGLEDDALRALSKESLQSVSRYYAEALTLDRFSTSQVDARVRMEGYEGVKDLLSTTDRGVVAVLSHSGNWDLVGAYASPRIIPVTAVAEILKPREMYEQFVQMREGVGIHVLGHEGGSTFRELIRIAKRERTLICLLSDRDLSGSGIEVEMWGHGVKVAPGPAALALAADVPIVPVYTHYERLSGERRRAAGSPWGVVLRFGEAIEPGTVEGEREDRVGRLSQLWATWMADQISGHPEDWHMMQRFGWVSEDARASAGGSS
ncbi:phosphatidylinositol mannoside acyltransferase [Demequina sp. NBRC 110056]|uniref:phosphatidylinositol mannoside acyltransferase n=1 Tax=Demequina sp. NBRC 110056 TaxID=1570345 RepID=UPI000A06CEFD|nr:phosphatidylinositol mannoside acyltransferase [Demequina sp. NBRC 110056]